MENVRALVLAAGKGTRMGTEVHKQFLTYRGEALFLKSVRVFLSCGIPVTVVTGEEDLPEARRLLDAADFPEIREGLRRPDLAAGGALRCLSSYQGLLHIKNTGGAKTVLIHDAARPFVTAEIIRSALESVEKYGSGVSAVNSKDTVKTADPEGFVLDTPRRSSVFLIQTPQAFLFDEILASYERMLASGIDLSEITDDSSVMEQFSARHIHLSHGSYENTKITTPDDLKYLE